MYGLRPNAHVSDRTTWVYDRLVLLPSRTLPWLPPPAAAAGDDAGKVRLNLGWLVDDVAAKAPAASTGDGTPTKPATKAPPLPLLGEAVAPSSAAAPPPPLASPTLPGTGMPCMAPMPPPPPPMAPALEPGPSLGGAPGPLDTPPAALESPPAALAAFSRAVRASASRCCSSMSSSPILYPSGRKVLNPRMSLLYPRNSWLTRCKERGVGQEGTVGERDGA